MKKIILYIVTCILFIVIGTISTTVLIPQNVNAQDPSGETDPNDPTTISQVHFYIWYQLYFGYCICFLIATKKRIRKKGIIGLRISAINWVNSIVYCLSLLLGNRKYDVVLQEMQFILTCKNNLQENRGL